MPNYVCIFFFIIVNINDQKLKVYRNIKSDTQTNCVSNITVGNNNTDSNNRYFGNTSITTFPDMIVGQLCVQDRFRQNIVASIVLCGKKILQIGLHSTRADDKIEFCRLYNLGLLKLN